MWLHNSLHGVKGGNNVGETCPQLEQAPPRCPQETIHYHPQPHWSIAGDKWKHFKCAWDKYALATGLKEKPNNVQVATLLTVIGEEAHKVYSTFTSWAHEGDSKNMGLVLENFQ